MGALGRMLVVLLILGGIIRVNISRAAEDGHWQPVGTGLYEDGVRVVETAPGSPEVLYAGTEKALYTSEDGGRSFRVVLHPAGERPGINDIAFSDEADGPVFAATDAGVYESQNGGRAWERIYLDSDVGARQSLSILRDRFMVYAGTARGLIRRKDGESNWQHVDGLMGREAVYQILKGDDRYLFPITGRAVFRLDRASGDIQTLLSQGLGRGSHDDGSAGDTDYSAFRSWIKSAAIMLTPSQSYLFVVTSNAIQYSFDQGQEWHPLPTAGMALNDVTTLAVDPDPHGDPGLCARSPQSCFRILAGTQKGVFRLRGAQWVPLYKGLATNRIADLTVSEQGAVYAATANGIYALSVEAARSAFRVGDVSGRDFQELQAGLAHEPTIQEVHRLAIEYAEVGRAKIERWRRQARRRAWLPDLDIGVDSSRDWSSSDSIWGSYSGGGQHYIGPDDKTRGEDIGWDVSLSWDLGDMIWSTDQTTIDSRSKLMVELREDILSEVTRLYFERRRIQAELAAGGQGDPGARFDREIRLAELTALIDGLTGGAFSRREGMED